MYIIINILGAKIWLSSKVIHLLIESIVMVSYFNYDKLIIIMINYLIIYLLLLIMS